MTTLADVNATLGVTNLALAGVSKNTEKTNEGITGFLDYLKGKDASDRRREIETDRETKASVLKTGLTATGRGIATAGKSAIGGLGSIFGGLGKLIPAGIGAGFLGSLLASRLVRFGIPALGLMFGDEIAEFLAGPEASEGFKKGLAGAIKGGSIGFLFGKKGFVIGTVIGGLLTNDKVDQELGNLTDNVKNLASTLFGVDKDSLSSILGNISDKIGDKIGNLNKLLKGDFDSENIVGSLELLAGAAFLISPIGAGKLAFAATAALSRSIAGRALLALIGAGALKRYVFDDTSSQGIDGPADSAAKIKSEESGGGFFDGILKTLKDFYKEYELIILGFGVVVGQLALELGLRGLGKGFKGLRNLMSKKPNVSSGTNVKNKFSPNPNQMDLDLDGKKDKNIFKKIMGKGLSFLDKAKNFGIAFLKNGGPMIVPIAAGTLLSEGEEMRGLNQKIQEGALKEFGVGGMRKGSLLNVYDPAMGAGFVDSLTNVSNAQSSNRLLNAMNLNKGEGLNSTLIDAGTVKVNSDNINTYQNSAIAIGGSGAFDIRDNLGKQIQGFGT